MVHCGTLNIALEIIPNLKPSKVFSENTKNQEFIIVASNRKIRLKEEFLVPPKLEKDSRYHIIHQPDIAILGIILVMHPWFAKDARLCLVCERCTTLGIQKAIVVDFTIFGANFAIISIKN